MYRDDPLDDEAELRAVIGHEPVDQLLDAERIQGDERSALLVALDAFRLLQGWISDDETSRWFVGKQRRLDDRTPVEALRDGDYEDVEEAARAFAAANG